MKVTDAVLVVLLGCHCVLANRQPQRRRRPQRRQADYSDGFLDENPPDTTYRGTSGVDYPSLDYLPKTNFRCEGRDLGYYADLETRCQVFHVCEAGNTQHDFLCPEGTIFNQKYIVCDWWYNVDCPRSPEFFELNEDFFKDGEVTSPPLPSTSIAVSSRQRFAGSSATSEWPSAAGWSSGYHKRRRFTIQITHQRHCRPRS
ncbi:U-scoloptoxin(01)-Cw1a-like [Panulirus ornatus]|uniref:U-scoloptoxin(01)-Cw1a-like n=1 Tax=Panulirus ornatus TaxID=150431 RepID=UPI003A86B4C7